MSTPPERLSALAISLRDALAAGDAAALAPLLSPHATWGACAGAQQVLASLGQVFAAGAPEAVSVAVLGDRLVVSGRLGRQEFHAAVFIEDGLVSEIRPLAGPDAAAAERPLGPLASAANRPVTISRLAPVLAVRSIGAAAEHYRQLGFAVQAYDGAAAYAFAQRDGVEVHLQQADHLDPATNSCALYLYVDDADALYAAWRQSGVAGRLVAPADTEYGLREGAHVDPDGNLWRFGSPLP
ncbi:MAG: bleomycin resistance protein [Acidimicrobiales bacterium]